jgi:hypothetical protein
LHLEDAILAGIYFVMCSLKNTGTSSPDVCTTNKFRPKMAVANLSPPRIIIFCGPHTHFSFINFIISAPTMRITGTGTILLCIVASAIAYSPPNNVAGNYHRAAAKREETSSFSTMLRMGGPADTPIKRNDKYVYSESYMRKLRSNARDAKQSEKEDAERTRAFADAQKLALTQSPSTTDKRFLGKLGQGLGDAAKGLVGVTVAAGKGVVGVTVAAGKGVVGVTIAAGKTVLRIFPWSGRKDVE